MNNVKNPVASAGPGRRPDTNRRKGPAWIVVLVIAAMQLSVDGAYAEDLATLKQRFKERYPQLMKLKVAGKIGETWQGKVAAVTAKHLADRAIADLVGTENKDRESLYRLLAADTKTKPQVVAERNAQRNFDRADKRHLLMARDGLWRSKADYARLMDYKKKGKLGETSDGLLDAVKSVFLSDRKLKALMEKDNALRRKAYEAIAKNDRKRSAEQVARQQGTKNLKDAAVGHYIRKADGSWHRVAPKRRSG